MGEPLILAEYRSPRDGEPGVAIRCAGLSKSFDSGLVRAVESVDLEIAPGEGVAVTGPTGCGKTTLLSLMALLEKPDAGELCIDGRPSADVGSPEDWRASSLGIVFQLHHLLPHLTAAENVALPLMGRGLARSASRPLVQASIERVGLGARAATLASRLSGGERQLVAIARALVGRPRLVLADEPTGSVDSTTGERVVQLLLDYCSASGATLVLVTHMEAVAGRLDRVIAMLDGRIVDQGRPRTASSPPSHLPGG